MKLGADAAARRTQVFQRDAGQQPLRGFDERFQRQPVVLVVLLAGLIANRRSEPDGAAGRPHEVNPEPVSRWVRDRIDQRVDQRSLQGRQFDVLAAAWVNVKRLAAERMQKTRKA